MPFLYRFFLCTFILAIALYSYIQKQNELTALRMKVPKLDQELKLLHDENTRLAFEIETFESPVNLIQLARKPEFGHLKHPYSPDIITVELPNE